MFWKRHGDNARKAAFRTFYFRLNCKIGHVGWKRDRAALQKELVMIEYSARSSPPWQRGRTSKGVEILNFENFFWVGLVGAVVALIFAWVQRKNVLKFSEGTDLMQKIAASIREGANAYLKRQYTTVAKVFLVVFVLLLIIAFASNGECSPSSPPSPSLPAASGPCWPASSA